MSKMKELIEAGLFGRGLILIEHLNLVDRYNACLQDMGLEETKLKKFQIDKMGWSPEVAEELGNDYYLSHGDANPLAIILTPKQATAPIYFPMHSFDWKLMDQWYELHKVQIVDLTKDTGIWLDIDQEVDLYAVPADLLMVSDVLVRVNTPTGLIAKADAQQMLVRRWLKEPDAQRDATLIAALEVSAQEDGDLRRRHLLIRDMQFSDVLDFYSRVFGGVFVLRSQNKEPLIIARDKKRAHGDNVVHADDAILELLIEHGYVETDVTWWQQHLHHLKVVAESFLVEVLDKHQPDLDYAELNQAEKKQLIPKYQDELSIHLELVRVRNMLKDGALPLVSPEVQVYLFHPNDTLSPSSREVVWQLLTYIQGGRFVPLMYRHQKTKFVEVYTKLWHVPRRSWALARVREYYDLASKSSQVQL